MSLIDSLTRKGRVTRAVILMALVAPMIAACSSGGGVGPTVKRAAFSSKEFGVSVSPRVTTKANPPKGGGRYMVGKPYTVRGKVYTPQENPQGYADRGQASWYGADFHGRRTANGEIFSANAITAAHPTLPLPSYVRVTNVENGRSVVVRVNDRGPYMSGRIMDLSHRAADILGYVNNGVGNIHASYIGPAPLNGDDTRMLLASVNRPTPMEQQSTTRLAMNPPNVAGQGDVTLSGGRINFGDLAGNAFGYADDAPLSAAHAAADALAGGNVSVSAAADRGQPVTFRLGTFRDAAQVARIAEAFARLGAVDEVETQLDGAAATALSLSYMKPGVDRSDVMALARELGLKDIVLY